MKNFDAESQKRMTSASKDMQKDLDKIFEENKGKTIDNKLIEKISGRLAKGLDPVTEEGVKEDMQSILLNGKSLVNESLAEKISNGSKKVLAQKFTEEQVAKMVPSKEEIVKHFNENQMMGKEVNEDEAMNVRSSVSQLFLAKAKEQGMSTEKLKTIKKGVALVADKAIKSNSASVLDENAMKKILY